MARHATSRGAGNVDSRPRHPARPQKSGIGLIVGVAAGVVAVGGIVLWFLSGGSGKPETPSRRPSTETRGAAASPASQSVQTPSGQAGAAVPARDSPSPAASVDRSMLIGDWICSGAGSNLCDDTWSVALALTADGRAGIKRVVANAMGTIKEKSHDSGTWSVEGNTLVFAARKGGTLKWDVEHADGRSLRLRAAGDAGTMDMQRLMYPGFAAPTHPVPELPPGTCLNCDGKGRLDPCPKCGGRGMRPARMGERSPQTCELCMGRGETACSACLGGGKTVFGSGARGSAERRRTESHEKRARRLGDARSAGDSRTAGRVVTTIRDDLRRMRRIVAGLGADMSGGRLASLTNEQIRARSFGDPGLTAAWREARRLALRDPNVAMKRAEAGATPLAPEDRAPEPEELVQAGVEKATAIRKVLREYATGLDASARKLHTLTDGQLTAWAGGDPDLLSAMWTARSLAQQSLTIQGKYTGPIQSLTPGGEPIYAGSRGAKPSRR